MSWNDCVCVCLSHLSLHICWDYRCPSKLRYFSLIKSWKRPALSPQVTPIELCTVISVGQSSADRCSPHTRRYTHTHQLQRTHLIADLLSQLIRSCNTCDPKLLFDSRCSHSTKHIDLIWFGMVTRCMTAVERSDQYFWRRGSIQASARWAWLTRPASPAGDLLDTVSVGCRFSQICSAGLFPLRQANSLSKHTKTAMQLLRLCNVHLCRRSRTQDRTVVFSVGYHRQRCDVVIGGCSICVR